MSLIDLDVLVLKCRNEQAKYYIEEAVKCYKAGAYRSSIVSTWNAIIFDFLHKLSELDMFGDQNAQSKLADYEKIRAGGDKELRRALEFERNLVDMALKDFEFITPLEAIDLKRLRDDRNRCAHPSMQTVEEPYQPTAELARNHIRNAVEIMLEKEPVQGKTVLDKLKENIESDYFPKNEKDAQEFLNASIFRNIRSNTKKSILTLLLKTFLTNETERQARENSLRAFIALVNIYGLSAEEIILNDLGKIINSTSDELLHRIIRLSKRIPIIFKVIDIPTKCKLKELLSDGNIQTIVNALSIEELEKAALKAVKDFDQEELIEMIDKLPKSLVKKVWKIVFTFFEQSSSFNEAETSFLYLILPIAETFDTKMLENVLNAVFNNSQIYGAWRTQTYLNNLFDETINPETAPIWQKVLENYSKHSFSTAYILSSLNNMGLCEDSPV